MKVSSEVLARIIERLYPPKSPYRFDVIGVELLGSIYERYLGNTIRTTDHQVRVEEKREVRKAGGVYYTPKYIVDYIVKETVGRLIEGKTPRQIEKIRVLDPACGSGSFLIGAFQYLIDYHVRYFLPTPKRHTSTRSTPTSSATKTASRASQSSARRGFCAITCMVWISTRRPSKSP